MADSTLTIVGSLGRDVDLRFTAGGKAVASLTVAVSNRYKNKADEWVDDTAWVDVTAWDVGRERRSLMREGYADHRDRAGQAGLVGGCGRQQALEAGDGRRRDRAVVALGAC